MESVTLSPSIQGKASGPVDWQVLNQVRDTVPVPHDKRAS